MVSSISDPDFADIEVEVTPITDEDIAKAREKEILYGGEQPAVIGGSYKELKDTYKELGSGHGYDAHHVLAHDAYKDVLDVSQGEGPSILMEKADHRETASWGTGKEKEAVRYREEQKSLLQEGKIQEAWMKDVNDIKSKFDDKYDIHLAAAEKQLLVLDKENKIELGKDFKQEIEDRQKIVERLDKACEEKNVTLSKELEKIKEIDKDIQRYKEEIKASYQDSLERYQQSVEKEEVKTDVEVSSEKSSFEKPDFQTEISDRQVTVKDEIKLKDNGVEKELVVTSEVEVKEKYSDYSNSFKDLTSNSKESNPFKDITNNSKESNQFKDLTSTDNEKKSFEDIVKPEIEVETTTEIHRSDYDSYSY